MLDTLGAAESGLLFEVQGESSNTLHLPCEPSSRQTMLRLSNRLSVEYRIPPGFRSHYAIFVFTVLNTLYSMFSFLFNVLKRFCQSICSNSGRISCKCDIEYISKVFCVSYCFYEYLNIICSKSIITYLCKNLVSIERFI